MPHGFALIQLLLTHTRQSAQASRRPEWWRGPRLRGARVAEGRQNGGCSLNSSRRPMCFPLWKVQHWILASTLSACPCEWACMPCCVCSLPPWLLYHWLLASTNVQYQFCLLIFELFILSLSSDVSFVLFLHWLLAWNASLHPWWCFGSFRPKTAREARASE